MWKRESGDWEQRRHRRRIVDTPQLHLPESKASPRHVHMFVNRDFQDEAPSFVRPAAVASEPLLPSLEVAQSPQWVLFTGVDQDMRFELRGYLNLHFGRVLALVEPLSISGGTALTKGGMTLHNPTVCCVYFESPVVAAQVVYAETHYFSVELGAACSASQYGATADGTEPLADSTIVECTAAWVSDPSMRMSLEPQLVPAATMPPSDAHGNSPFGRSSTLPGDAVAPTRSTSFPSDRSSSSAATVGESPEIKGHHRSAARGSTVHNSRWSADCNTSMLSMFVTSSISGNVWVSVLRIIILILWTGGNAVMSLLGREQHPSGQLTDRSFCRSAAAASTENLHHAIFTFSQRRRRRLRVSGTFLYDDSLNPLDNAFLALASLLPLAPSTMDVDVLLWSWLRVRSPYTEYNLRQLRSYLDQQALPRTSLVNPLPTHLSGDGRPYRSDAAVPPVLITWRPIWWFTRYVVVSSLLLFWVLWRATALLLIGQETGEL